MIPYFHALFIQRHGMISALMICDFLLWLAKNLPLNAMSIELIKHLREKKSS